LEIFTRIGDESVVLPAASRARAVSKWVPLVLRVVFQDSIYGLVRSSADKLPLSSLNWTPMMPVLSEAEAVTVRVPDPFAPFAGEVIDTIGGIVSEGGGGGGVEALPLPSLYSQTFSLMWLTPIKRFLEGI